jgi:colanic acid biosynthesis glycosyl transferase WcaI
VKALITTSYYWPETVGTAPLVTEMAEHFARRGHEVTVVTAYPHYPSWTPPAERPLRRREQRGGVAIERRWHYVPGSQSALRRAAYEATLLAGGLTALPGDAPHAIIGVIPSLAAGMHAAAAARLHRRPHGIIVHDLLGRAATQSGVAGGARVAGAVRAAELATMRGAARVGVVAEGFRAYLEEGGVEPGRIDRVHVWARRTEPVESPGDAADRLGLSSGSIVCMHAGNMGHKQGLANLLETAALLRDDDNGVAFALAGDGNERAQLEEMAGRLRLENVLFLPVQPAGRYEAMLEAADILIMNQRATVRDMSMPSKLPTYFAASRPVVAAVAPDSETAREIEASGGGVVVAPGDPQALAGAIRGLAADPDERRRLGAAGRAYAEERLSAPAALAEYERFLEHVAGGAPGRQR